VISEQHRGFRRRGSSCAPSLSRARCVCALPSRATRAHTTARTAAARPTPSCTTHHHRPGACCGVPAARAHHPCCLLLLLLFEQQPARGGRRARAGGPRGRHRERPGRGGCALRRLPPVLRRQQRELGEVAIVCNRKDPTRSLWGPSIGLPLSPPALNHTSRPSSAASAGEARGDGDPSDQRARESAAGGLGSLPLAPRCARRKNRRRRDHRAPFRVSVPLNPLAPFPTPPPNHPQEDPGLTRNWNKTIKVAVTGASGNISNHLLFMVRR
jgi:hypothetical protein